jgi:hypothetical protein
MREIEIEIEKREKGAINRNPPKSPKTPQNPPKPYKEITL